MSARSTRHQPCATLWKMLSGRRVSTCATAPTEAPRLTTVETGPGTNDTAQFSRITISLMRGCLVATIQVDLNRTVLEQFRSDVLEKLASSRARRIILDCSGIRLLDAEDFDTLRRTIAMASLMGARTVLAGLQPGVVSALVDFNVNVDRLETVF